MHSQAEHDKWALNDPAAFLNPHGEIDIEKNRLPHWQQGVAWIFVTWRLADSLPKEKLARWREERRIWLSLHPKPWDKSTESEYHSRFSKSIDAWLDRGHGTCILKKNPLASIVADALNYFDDERYRLAAYVVMPNHVHVLFQPLKEYSLAALIKTWKGYTARKINEVLGNSGMFWGEDYWDRLMRDPKHFTRTLEYIRKNPKKANLKHGEYLLWIR